MFLKRLLSNDMPRSRLLALLLVALFIALAFAPPTYAQKADGDPDSHSCWCSSNDQRDTGNDRNTKE